MKVVVTGAAGFIGAYVAARLLSDGHEVLGIDNLNVTTDPALKQRRVEGLLDREGFRFERADLKEDATLDLFEAFRPQGVVHLAGRAGVRASVADPAPYMQDNVAVTSALLQRAVRAGSVEHFTFASSSSVYGDGARAPFREDDATDRPISPYAATKKACELLGHAFHHAHGLPVTALRFFSVYGPLGRPDMAVDIFARAMLAGQAVPMYGDGSMERDYTFVEDIADGVVRILSQPRGFEVVNLGNDSPVALSRLIEVLGEAVGVKPEIKPLPAPPGDVTRTHADITKARTLYGYAPRTSITEGARRVVARMRDDQRSGLLP